MHYSYSVHELQICTPFVSPRLTTHALLAALRTHKGYLFALVEEMKKRFCYLNQTVAIVLGVVAIKLLAQDIYKIPTFASLALVIIIFTGGIVLSLRHNKKAAAQEIEGE